MIDQYAINEGNVTFSIRIASMDLDSLDFKETIEEQFKISNFHQLYTHECNDEFIELSVSDL